MDSKKRILITIGIGIILMVGFFFITNSITKHTGFSVSEFEEDNLGSCLKGQEINLYINTDESVKTLQKINLFNYLQYFQITNCLNNNQECLENNVNSFPTWVIDGKVINRDINFNELTEYSRCNLINND